MEGGRVVVDASIAVKWFIIEEYSKEARLLRDAYAEGLIDLAAPELLPFLRFLTRSDTRAPPAKMNSKKLPGFWTTSSWHYFG